MFDYVWRNAVAAWCLACSQGVHGLAELINGRLRVVLFMTDMHSMASRATGDTVFYLE